MRTGAVVGIKPAAVFFVEIECTLLAVADKTDHEFFGARLPFNNQRQVILLRQVGDELEHRGAGTGRDERFVFGFPRPFECIVFDAQAREQIDRTGRRCQIERFACRFGSFFERRFDAVVFRCNSFCGTFARCQFISRIAANVQIELLVRLDGGQVFLNQFAKLRQDKLLLCVFRYQRERLVFLHAFQNRSSLC